MKHIETDTLVLGGGWSGLLAASALSREKRSFVLLEKEPELGGLARTFSLNGFRYDIGGHRIHFKNRANWSFLNTLIKVNELLYLKRKSKLFFENKFINYPPTVHSLFAMKGIHLLKILFQFSKVAGNPRSLRLENFEQWVKSNYGHTLYEILFKDYTEKVWGVSCDQLSSCWAGRRIGENPFLNVFRLFYGGDDLKERNPSFYYPAMGMGQVIQVLADSLPPKAVIRGGFPVRFHSNNKRLKRLTAEVGGEEVQISFEHLMTSIPLAELFHALAVPFNKVKEVSYRSLLLVSLVYEYRSLPDWQWCYFPSDRFIFSRLYIPKNWSPGMVPASGQVLVCAEIFCDFDDSCWNCSEEELAAKVDRDIMKSFVFQGMKVNAWEVKRFRYAYPLLYLNYEKKIRELKERSLDYENLSLIGRSGTHAYFDLEECLENVKQEVEGKEA